MNYPSLFECRFRDISAGIGCTILLFCTASVAAAETPGNAARGKIQFLQCQACHTVNAGDRDGVGPNLNGVVGAKAGARQGFKYSAPMSASGISWTPKALDAFLEKPSGIVPGTTMAFAGVASAQGRQDLIAYISTFGAKRGKSK